MESMLIGIGLAVIICGLYTIVENHLIFRDMQKQMKKHMAMMDDLNKSRVKLRLIMDDIKGFSVKT